MAAISPTTAPTDGAPPAGENQDGIDLFIGVISLREAPERLQFFMDGWARAFGPHEDVSGSTKPSAASNGQEHDIQPNTTEYVEVSKTKRMMCRGMPMTTGMHAKTVRPHFLQVDRDPTGGLIGCTRSHLAVWRAAREHQQKHPSKRGTYCLVFEDDVQVNAEAFGAFANSGGFTACLKLMDRGRWDVLRLHKTGICRVHGRVGGESDLELYHASSLCGRAYVVSPRCYEHVLKVAENWPVMREGIFTKSYAEGSKCITPYTYYL